MPPSALPLALVGLGLSSCPPPKGCGAGRHHLPYRAEQRLGQEQAEACRKDRCPGKSEDWARRAPGGALGDLQPPEAPKSSPQLESGLLGSGGMGQPLHTHLPPPLLPSPVPHGLDQVLVNVGQSFARSPSEHCRHAGGHRQPCVLGHCVPPALRRGPRTRGGGAAELSPSLPGLPPRPVLEHQPSGATCGLGLACPAPGPGALLAHLWERVTAQVSQWPGGICCPWAGLLGNTGTCGQFAQVPWTAGWGRSPNSTLASRDS